MCEVTSSQDGADPSAFQIVVDGDLDLFAACHVARELQRNVRQGAARLRLDLTLVPWTNASALHHLAIALAELALRPGVAVVVTGAGPAVDKMLTLARLDGALAP